MKPFRPGGLFKSNLKMRPDFYLPPKYKDRHIDVPTKNGIEMNPFALLKNLFKKGDNHA